MNNRHFKSDSEADPKEAALNRVREALKFARVDEDKSAEIMELLNSPFFLPSFDVDSENWIKVYRRSWAEAEADAAKAIQNKSNVVDIVTEFKPMMTVALDALVRNEGKAVAIALNNVVARTGQALSIILSETAQSADCSVSSMNAVAHIVAFGVSYLLVPTIGFEGKKELFDCIVEKCLPAVKAGLVPLYYNKETHVVYVCGLQGNAPDVLRD